MVRILIADDNADTRAFVRSALGSRGWTICGEAANGRQAVLMASELKPDLVIVDLSMPMMTGLELLYQAMIHTAHTRGYGEMYLRNKGVTPPTYDV